MSGGGMSFRVKPTCSWGGIELSWGCDNRSTLVHFEEDETNHYRHKNTIDDFKGPHGLHQILSNIYTMFDDLLPPYSKACFPYVLRDVYTKFEDMFPQYLWTCLYTFSNSGLNLWFGYTMFTNIFAPCLKTCLNRCLHHRNVNVGTVPTDNLYFPPCNAGPRVENTIDDYKGPQG